MRTTLLTAAILAGLTIPGLAIPSAASAQIQAQVLPFGDPLRELPVQLYGTMAPARPISRTECSANLAIPIEIANMPADAVGKVFSVWRGAVGSAMCEQSTSRMNATGTPACTRVPVADNAITATTQTIRPTVQELFGAEACTTATNTEYEFWFLIVSSVDDVSTTVPANYFFRVRILLDTQAPGAPVVDESPGGDTQIQITWENPSASEGLYGAHVYVDPGGCDASGNVISGGTLVAGGDPPTGIEPVLVEGQSVDSATLDGAAAGLEYGEYAAVAVTIMDRARNEGVLSNVVCMQRVQVSGFWDAYCAEAGVSDPAACRDRYTCSAMPGAGRRSLLVLSALALVLALTASRRRSSR